MQAGELLAELGKRDYIALRGQAKSALAMSVAGVNNFQWFILSIAVLVPIMVVAMKWANSHSHHD